MPRRPPTMPIDVQILLARGALALRTHLAGMHGAVFLGLDEVAVVTRADFELHPGLCLDHAVSVRSLYILDAGGALCALLSQMQLPLRS